ncbi:MAG: 2-hydroxychromene-2-carboxylate isomerase, partial [bacterium]
AYHVLPKIAQRAKVAINWKPVLLGGIFKATGNASPAMVPAKGQHMGRDIQRFCEKYEVDYQHNPYFPINTLQLMRGAISYQQEGNFQDFMRVIFNAMWKEPKNLGDQTILANELDRNGFSSEDFFKRIQAPEVKTGLIQATESAVKRGLFGCPATFVDDDMFFGQDRMHFVAEALGVNICDVFPKFIASP